MDVSRETPYVTTKPKCYNFANVVVWLRASRAERSGPCARNGTGLREDNGPSLDGNRDSTPPPPGSDF